MKKMFVQFAKFGMVGVSNVIVTYGTYYLLLFLHVHYIFSNTLGYILGIFNSYYWNNKYVFENKIDNTAQKMTKLFASYLLTYVLNTVMLFLLVQYFEFSELVAPVLVIIITTPMNFILNKLWVFKERKDLYENDLDSHSNL